MRIITLTTDFGLVDPFVGFMKGVMLSMAPDIRIVDLTHGIPPQDILSAALALEAAVDYFPAGTIHLAVVDPGVGTDRHALAVETDSAIFLGPDNGIFTLALDRHPAQRIISLQNPQLRLANPSATFHRDIFAPAAAHLASGIPLESLGPIVESIRRLEIPSPTVEENSISARVIAFDHFGNAITNLTWPVFNKWLGEGRPVSVALRTGDHVIPGLSRTYADVDVGAPVAYFGSGGRLEIGVRNGSAEQRLRLRKGQDIQVTRS